jgi:uroporphyrinogen decarboxylase
MEESPPPENKSLPSLAGARIATLAGAEQGSLREFFQGLGAEIDFCQSHTPEDEIIQEREERRVISDFANRLLTGEIDFLLALTGAGFRYWVKTAARQVPEQRFLEAISDITSISGSPSATAAMQLAGIEPTIVVPSPVSWRDILIAIDQHPVRISSFQVGLEESEAIAGLSSGLEARGGRVLRLPVYFQSPPRNPSPVLRFFERIEGADFRAILFTSPAEVVRYVYLCKNFGRSRSVAHSLDYLAVLAIGTDVAELLTEHQIPPDFVATDESPEGALIQIASQMSDIQQRKQTLGSSLSGPAADSSDVNASWYESPFMKACRGEPTAFTPIWMMRQAGRYMQEYRQVRDKVGFLELCYNPQLCSEVMCTAVDRLGVDAAIIFSDLLPMLVPMGMDLEFAQGDGPTIHNPIRNAGDLQRVRRIEHPDELAFVMETVRLTRNDLPEDIPLIGFAGAPFTLASYMIEGGASRNYAHTKQLMFTDRGAWHELMQTLADSIAVYLNGQIAAGAQCVQLFDSWAGCLAFDDYKSYVQPYVQQLIDRLPAGVPVINFATGNPGLLPLLADTRAAVIGIDWRVRLDQAWETVGFQRSVQGNLDPTVLLTNPQEIRRQAQRILDLAAGRPGHIFNLGHGILPQTPVENAIALVEAVHELSQR